MSEETLRDIAPSEKSHRRVVLEVLFSFVIVLHLMLMWILPNPASILGRRVPGFMYDYANLLGINSTWKFYSPDPPPSLFVEYEILNDQGEGIKTGRWPDVTPQEIMQERYNRRMTSARLFSSFPQMMENVFIPWLCEKHKGADRVFIRQVILQVPHIEKARVEDQDFTDMTREDQTMGYQFPCRN